MTLSRGQRVCIPITIPNQTMQAYAVLELLGFTFQNTLEGTPSSSSSPESVIQDPLHPFQCFSDSPGSCEVAQAFTEKKSSRLNRANGLIRGGERKLASQRMSPRKSLSPKESNHAGSVVEENSKHHQVHAATTFVQADSSSFRELVQQLTGAGETPQDKLPATLPTKSAARQFGSFREEVEGGGTLTRRSEAGAGELKVELASPAKLREGRQSSKGLEIRRDTDNFKRKYLSSLLQGISVQDIQALLSTPRVMSSHNNVLQTIHFPSPSSEQEIDQEGNNNLESILAESSPAMEECSFFYPQLEMQSKSELKLLPLFPVHS